MGEPPDVTKYLLVLWCAYGLPTLAREPAFVFTRVWRAEPLEDVGLEVSGRGQERIGL